MSTIHPTAILSEDVKLGSHVTIGPYCLLEGPVTLHEGVVLRAGVHLLGEVEIGERTQIHSHAVIGDWPQDLSFSPQSASGVKIGHDNMIRENVTIHRASQEGASTTVGDHNFLMAGAHLAHDTQVGHHTIIANNCLLAGHVVVGDHVFLGGGSVFHQFMKIGSYAMTQGNSGLGKDLPPFCVGSSVNQLSGLNIVGLKRAGFSPAERKEIKSLYALLFQKGLTLTGALAEAEKTNWSVKILPLLEAVRSPSKRGVLVR